MWRSDSRRTLLLVGLAAVALLMQLGLEATRTPRRQRDYELKLAAARKAEQAFASLRRKRHMEGAELDLVNDPAGTGLIGPEFSPITNARGNLEAKLTSLDPNFAGVMVELLRRAGVQAGDPVAVAISGSFPALNICLYAALETLELSPVVITSVGASMWGANDPRFTWLDMESYLASERILHIRSLAATLGGGDDMGRGLSPTGRRLLREAIARNGIPLLKSRNLEDAIAKRMAFYAEKARGRRYRCYVNIGGGVASLGSSRSRILIPRGLSFSLDAANWPRKGTLALMADKGVPVIHFLQIAELARDFGLPVAPDYTPAAGEGEIFVRDTYRLPLVAAAFIVYLLLCGLLLAPEARLRLASAWRLRNGKPEVEG